MSSAADAPPDRHDRESAGVATGLVLAPEGRRLGFGVVATVVFACALAGLLAGCSAGTFAGAALVCAMLVAIAFAVDSREERRREMRAVSGCDIRARVVDGAIATPHRPASHR